MKKPQDALTALYLPSAKAPVLVNVPKLNFLMIDGKGSPNGPGFAQAVDALYNVCYTMKFMHPKGDPVREGKVWALEALWTAGSGFDQSPDTWEWTAMIMQPAIITRNAVNAAIAEVRKKKNPPALAGLRFGSFSEGWAVQILYIGPYSGERPTIRLMHDFAAGQGYTPKGPHHEIYLSDPSRTKPEKLKTVLRQAVARSSSSSAKRKP